MPRQLYQFLRQIPPVQAYWIFFVLPFLITIPHVEFSFFILFFRTGKFDPILSFIVINTNSSNLTNVIETSLT